MIPQSSITLAASESVPDGLTVLIITAVGLAIIIMLVLVLGRRYRRMVLGDPVGKRAKSSDAPPDAWSESAKRVQMSDNDADDPD